LFPVADRNGCDSNVIHMKNLSSILAATLVTLVMFSSVAYTSCRKERDDQCIYVVCYNGGTCTGGLCTCPPDYEGRQCEKKK
jgi:hypothetical protein